MKKSKLVTAIKENLPLLQTNKRKFVQCATEVNRDAVRRESIDGVEHIIVSSSTLPDDIVMNGGLYPADEISTSYESLERTLAPVEHPSDSDGNFISASDPIAIHNFHAGAFNSNVRRENGRVPIDKVISVQEAMKTDRGKRLLDRINEFETNDNPRPIHSSVGVWLEVEQTDGPQTNAAGQEYNWIARNMEFDHDAILLDSVGAAQPHQGVGIAVNEAGDKFDVEQVTLPTLTDNEGGLTHSELHEQLVVAISNMATFDYMNIIDIVDDEEKVIFETNQGFFEVPYRVDNGTARIVGIPLPVDRNVTFTPKQNSKIEGDAMKEMLINALAEAGVETEGLDDAQLLEAYTALQANQSSDDTPATDDNSQLADIVANAVAPLADKIGELEGKLNAKAEDEKSGLVEIITNSGKYPGLDAESAKLLPTDKLKEMAANCTPSHGLPFSTNQDNSNDIFDAPADMPK